MKAVYGVKVSVLGITAYTFFQAIVLADPFSLVLKSSGPRVELSWPTAITNAGQGQVLPEYEVQYSTDLKNWSPIGGKIRGIEGLTGPSINVSLDRQKGPLFYRVIADALSRTANQTGTGGGDVLGYNSSFASQLSQLGLLSVADFATNGSGLAYLPQISWDVTSARFWTNFSSTNLYIDSVPDYETVPSSSTNIIYNYLLDTNELALFVKNGFVVSERLGSASFADGYYRIFNADLPVFVTTDSILQAWHKSYQRMLEELEELQLSTLLQRVISNMSLELPQTWQQYGQGPLKNSILDADYFLTVARSIWAAQQVPSALGDAAVDQQVATTLIAINNQVLVEYFPIFGSVRGMDFSQFIVRGHYTESERLRRYFRMMMWCGRTELRLATFAPNKEDDIRQLGTAVVMDYLLSQSGQFSNWATLEQVACAFVGPTDSMTFAQLRELLANANIQSPGDVPDLVTLTNLQARLLSGELGVQAIQGEYLRSPFGREQLRLPRSFTIAGQKFIMDSWAFSQLVVDRVLWSPDYGTNIIFGKVMRRKPSCLDAAFAVLDNSQVVPELVNRMTNENGVPFRDGPHLPYQHNLLAVRKVVDEQEPAVWTDNIYTAWLAALRELSSPTTDPSYPESMRTQPWAMKTLNTQLASWTQLRHDTVLYTKQSYTAEIVCDYPAGFVEPWPEFWRRMKTLAEITGAALSNLSLSGPADPPHENINLSNVHSNQLSFLTNFAAQVSTLADISERELAQEPLTIEETDFLKNLIEQVWAYANFRQWNGWYPGLFYRNVFFNQNSWIIVDLPDCDFWDALVTDVHTDPPDLLTGDPGAVIHEGVANVNLLLIAVDNGPDRMVYAGPVFSHYEFEMPANQRLSDADWKARILAGQKPPPPEWTSSYLVPGNIPIPPGNQ